MSAAERVELPQLVEPVETPQAVLLPGFAGPTLPAWLAARLRNGLAGVCLFATNIESRAQLRELTTAILEANPFAIIAIDEEGGDVTRLYSDQGSPYPGNALLGRIDDLEFTREVAQTVGWELRLAGVNLDLAPDVDINSNPDNPVIGTRSFGATAELVARHSAAWIEGLQSTGVAASAKHFPGHGDTGQDSHLALPVIELSIDELLARELRPFVAAVSAQSKTIMTSHILVRALDADRPATLSRHILQDILRGELAFGGVIVTDALDMRGASGEVGIPEAAVLALAAGSDLLCIGTDNTDEQLADIAAAIDRAVTEGRLDRDRVREAAGRVRALATELLTETARIPVPEWIADGSEPQFEFELDRVSSVFEVRPGVVVPTDATVVTLETTANIAVGASPWGLEAAGEKVLHLREGEPLPHAAALVIVGKDIHRREWTKQLVDLARERHPSTLVIDMGWPSDDRHYADIATFGASRYVGRALAAWLRKAEQK
jgi:beta-N-acetylhexosaminidase